jgi:glyceraldehyde 3-phosphate dehydrogenase
MAKKNYESELELHVNHQRSAIALQNTVGNLLYTKGIELVFFRTNLVDTKTSEILKLHEYANQIGKPVEVELTAEMANVIAENEITNAKLDVGLLAYEWTQEGEKFKSKAEFLNNKLTNMRKPLPSQTKPGDAVLYGFGRIGRLVARELITQSGKGQHLRLRAIVIRNVDAEALKKRAALFKNDSVHGAFDGTVEIDTQENIMKVNGQCIHIIQAKEPEDVDYTQYGIKDALVIDNTGVFKDKEALSRHLKSKGASRVLLTAPGKGVPNVVYGINHHDVDADRDLITSAASCTTNAIAPVLKVIEDKLGVVKGHIETVHAYTNDQNLLDNMHKKPRRGRSAAINMVITSTGAATAITKIIPSLEKKLTANGVRVPTPNGSLAIMNLTVGRETSVEEVNALVKDAALHGPLVNQLNYQIEEELVSSDIIGNPCCSVFDSNATIVSDDKQNIVIYAWYDNEFGYTKQVIRLAKYAANVRRSLYY